MRKLRHNAITIYRSYERGKARAVFYSFGWQPPTFIGPIYSELFSCTLIGAISISFPYDSYLENWTGIGIDVTGRNVTLIDDAPNELFWWTAIGATQYYPTSPTIPGPRNITSVAYVVKQVELYLYVISKKGKGQPQIQELLYS